MPRFFFNTHIGDELVSDPEGEELRDLDRAWEVARAMIRELLKTEGAERSLLSAILEVTDDEGEVVLEFPFAEAILDMSDEPVTKHRRQTSFHKISDCVPTEKYRRLLLGRATSAGIVTGART